MMPKSTPRSEAATAASKSRLKFNLLANKPELSFSIAVPAAAGAPARSTTRPLNLCVHRSRPEKWRNHLCSVVLSIVRLSVGRGIEVVSSKYRSQPPSSTFLVLSYAGFLLLAAAWQQQPLAPSLSLLF